MPETLDPREHVKPFVYDTAHRKALHFSISEIQSRMNLKDPYALDLEQKTITVKRGMAVEVKIKATRQMGQTAAIPITVAGQPANVTPTAQPVPANANEVVLKIATAANAAPGTYTLIITGNLSNNVQPAPALLLTITE